MKKNRNSGRGSKRYNPKVRAARDTFIEPNLGEFATYALEHDRSIVTEEDLFKLNAIANDYRAGVKIPKSRHLEAERAKQRALDAVKTGLMRRIEENALSGESGH